MLWRRYRIAEPADAGTNPTGLKDESVSPQAVVMDKATETWPERNNMAANMPGSSGHLHIMPPGGYLCHRCDRSGSSTNTGEIQCKEPGFFDFEKPGKHQYTEWRLMQWNRHVVQFH